MAKIIDYKNLEILERLLNDGVIDQQEYNSKIIQLVHAEELEESKTDKQPLNPPKSTNNSSNDKNNRKPLVIVLFILLIVILLAVVMLQEGIDVTPHMSLTSTEDLYGKWTSPKLGSIELSKADSSVVPNYELLSIKWDYSLEDQTVEIHYYLSAPNLEEFNRQYANELGGRELNSSEAAEYIVTRNKIPPDGLYHYDNAEDKLVFDGTDFYLMRE